MTDLFEGFEVFGIDEYGGVQLECRTCEVVIAEGGCTCCKDNTTTLDQLIRAAEAHNCSDEI
ncbi:hypothetical protein ACWDTQ_28255 [Streptomyces cellulosae]